MKDVIKFKEWQDFNIVVGKIEEIKENKLLVNVGEKLINCGKGSFEYEIGEKVIVLLENNEGRILSVSGSLLTLDKDIMEGSVVG